jgi:hypothetical protein
MMAEYDSSTINYGKFEKQSNAPDFARYASADESLTASAKQAAQTAEMLNMFAKEGGAAYQAKVNKDRRDAVEARRKEMEARQKLARDKNLAEIEAERLRRVHGGEAWDTLEKEKLESTDEYRDKNTYEENLASGGLIKKGKLSHLRKNDKQSNEQLALIKAAYQRKTTEAALKREQIEFDELTPTLVTNLRQQFLDQKDLKDENGNRVGVESWTEYATAQLEIIKVDQGQLYSGLPQLGEAGRNVPLNHSLFNKNVASYEHADRKEKTNNAIQAGLNEYSKEIDLSDISSIDSVIQDISAVPNIDDSGSHPSGVSASGKHPSGKKVQKFQRDENGKVVRLYPKEAVWKQFNKDQRNQIENATSSSHPSLKIVEALGPNNHRKAQEVFDRGGGKEGSVGSDLEKTYDLAVAKKLSLLKAEKAARKTKATKTTDEAKVSSASLLMEAESALLYSNLSPGVHKGKTDSPMMEDGTVQGQPSKVETVARAYINLSNSKDVFAEAGMHKEWTTKMQALGAELNELDPESTTFNVAEGGQEQLDKYRKIHSKSSVEELIQERVTINSSTDLEAWERKHQNEIIDNLIKQKKEVDTIEITRLNVIAKKATIEKTKLEKTSGTKKLELSKRIRNKNGNIVSAEKLTELLADVQQGSGMTVAHITELENKVGPIIDRQKKAEQYTNDVTTHETIFNDIISLSDGKFKTVEQLNEAVKNIGDIKDPALKASLRTLLAAREKGAAEFAIAKDNLTKEITYKKKLVKLTAQTDRKIDKLVENISRPKTNKDGTVNTKHRTIAQATQDLKDLETEFFRAESPTGKMVAEGNALGIKGINNFKRFTSGHAAILGKRTEEQVAAGKLELKRKSIVQEKKREAVRTELRLEIVKITKNPNADAGQVDDPISGEDRLKEIIESFDTEITEDGLSFAKVPHFTAEEQAKIMDEYAVEKALKALPPDTSDSSSKIKAFDNFNAIETLTGKPRMEAIKTAETYIRTELKEGRLSGPDFNSERTKLHNIGKPAKTKPAVDVGEDHIRSIFAGHMSKFQSNKRFLPINEDGKLYNLLSKEFNAQWAALTQGKLLGADEETLTRAAGELAGTFTQVYAKDEMHPIPEANERLRRYSMDKEALSKIYWREFDEKEALLKKEEAEKLKLSGGEAQPVERELSQAEKALEDDSRKFNTTVNRDMMDLWEVIVEGTGNIITGRSNQNQFQQVSY